MDPFHPRRSNMGAGGCHASGIPTLVLNFDIKDLKLYIELMLHQG